MSPGSSASAPASGSELANIAPSHARVWAESSILDTPARNNEAAAWTAGAGSLSLHILGAALALALSLNPASPTAPPPVVTELFELAPAPKQVTPPTAAAPVEPPKPPAPRLRAKPAAAKSAETAPGDPPPSAAQSASMVSAAQDVVDFSDSMVMGSSTFSAGGQTHAAGTSNQAQHAAAHANGAPAGRGTALVSDRSRAPQLAGGAEWNCPFPEEADEVDEASVTLRVEVAADGRVLSARPTRESSSGFGREAQRCALSKQWSPGLDRAGQPIVALALVNVRFVR